MKDEVKEDQEDFSLEDYKKRAKERGFDYELVYVPCAGECGRKLHCPKPFAEMMEKMGTPMYCTECRAKARGSKGVGVAATFEKGQEPGEAPVVTTLTIIHVPKEAMKDAGEPPYGFKLVPSRYEEQKDEVQILMKLHLALMKYIALRSGKTDKGASVLNPRKQIVQVPKAIAKRLMRSLGKRTR